MDPPATRTGSKILPLAGFILVFLMAGAAAVWLFYPRETPFMHAVSLMKAGKAAKSLQMLEQIHKEEPDNKSVYPWLAQGYLVTERLGEGRTALDTALRLRLPSGELAPVVISYADFYQGRGDFSEAEKLFESARSVCSDEELYEGKARLYLAWGESLVDQKKLELATEKLQQGCEISGRCQEPLKSSLPRRLSSLYRQMAAVAEINDKNDSEAISLLKKSLTISDSPHTWMALADIYTRLGRTRDAIGAYEKVRDSDPNNLEAQHRLIELLLAAGDIKAAQESLQKLTDIERSVDNYQLLATLNLQLGNHGGAVKALEDATNLRPDDIETTTRLKNALYEWTAALARQGKGDEAESVRGHAERVSEQLERLRADAKKEEDERLSRRRRPGPGQPPIVVTSSKVWLSRGSYTPEGEIEIKNITGKPVRDLSLTIVFYDNTAKRRNGSVLIPVASPGSRAVKPDERRTLYFSCPNIVKPNHHLAVIVFWKGKLLKEFPVVKRR